MMAADARRDQPTGTAEDKGQRFEPIDIEALIDAITDANRHGETDTGQPVGREVW